MIDATDLPLTADPQKMINQLARLVEISVTLNSTLQLEPLLEYIMDTAAERALLKSLWGASRIRWSFV